MNKSDVQNAGLEAEAKQTQEVEKVIGNYPFEVIGVQSGFIVFTLQHRQTRASGGENQQVIKKLKEAGYRWGTYRLRDNSVKRGWS